MPANYFRKAKSLYSSTANSFGTGEGETITPASIAGLPTDTELVLTFDRTVSGKLERILGTISGSNFVVSSGGRGYDGTTEQSHTSPVVEYIPNAGDTNDLVTGLLVEHDQDGTHTSAVTSSVTAASTTAAGKIEIAIASEINTGTDATRAVSPDSLAGSNYGVRVVGVSVTTPAGTLTAGNGAAYFRIPSVMNGWNLVGVAGSMYAANTTGGPVTVMIRNKTQAADMLSTALTIDDNETDSATAAAAAVIDAANDDVATGDQIAIDVDDAGSDGTGLFVELQFQLP